MLIRFGPLGGRCDFIWQPTSQTCVYMEWITIFEEKPLICFVGNGFYETEKIFLNGSVSAVDFLMLIDVTLVPYNRIRAKILQNEYELWVMRDGAYIQKETAEKATNQQVYGFIGVKCEDFGL